MNLRDALKAAYTEKLGLYDEIFDLQDEVSDLKGQVEYLSTSRRNDKEYIEQQSDAYGTMRGVLQTTITNLEEDVTLHKATIEDMQRQIDHDAEMLRLMQCQIDAMNDK